MTEQPDTPAITTYPEMDAKIVALLRLMPDEASLTALYAAQRIEELEARAARSAQTIDGLIRERDAALQLVAKQKERINWLLDAQGGAAHDASYVRGVEAERDAARALAEERADALQSAFNFIEGSSTSPFGPRYAIEGISEALSPTDPLRSRIPESNAIDYKRLAETLAEALRWYADGNHYDTELDDPDDHGFVNVLFGARHNVATDDGERARAALAAMPTREEGDADASA